MKIAALITACGRGNLLNSAPFTFLQTRESCGQCTPCHEGTVWLMRIMERMVEGNVKIEEIDQLYNLTNKSKVTQSALWVMLPLGCFKKGVKSRHSDTK